MSSREAVGFLPENPYFYKYLTGAETLHFYGKLCGLRGQHLRARSNELLALVGLEKARDRRLGGYSKGMLQRIGLAQALIQEPRLLVLDEPTAGVDPAGSPEIRDLILDLKDRGITVLLSSHLLAQVQEICDRVGILAQGVLVREGSVERAARDRKPNRADPGKRHPGGAGTNRRAPRQIQHAPGRAAPVADHARGTVPRCDQVHQREMRSAAPPLPA